MSKSRIQLLMLIGAAALALAHPGPAIGQSYEDKLWNKLLEPQEDLQGWPRHFRLGALVGFNIKGQFSMGGTFTTGNNPGPTGVSGANHTYDNGYVLLDARNNAQGRTWNWGYQSTNQLHSDGLLYFDAVESYSYANSTAQASSGAEVGIDVAYGGHLTRWGSALVGWEVGFGWLPVNIKDNRQMLATVSRVTHSFSPGGIQVPGFMGEPGQGDFVYEGTFNGPGAAILDTATAAGTAIIPNVPLSSDRTLDVDVFSFRLGPTLHWEIHPRFAVEVSAGAAFGVASGDVEFNDTMVVQGSTVTNHGKSNSTEFTYGGYVAATLMYHAVKNGDIYLGLQYMPMTSTTFGSNGSEAELDLSGALYISAGINWPF